MPSSSMLAAMMMAGFALSLSPGPSMFYVLSRSVGQSRSAGLASSVGLAVGGMVLALLSALGVVAVLERWPSLFTVVQVMGGLYLTYLGIGMIREAQQARGLAVESVVEDPLSTVFRQGVVVEALNPKTALFLISFVPQFVDPTRGDTRWQLVILGLLVPLTAIPCDVVVSFFGGSVAERFRRNPTAAVVLNWVAGTILLGLAAKVLLSSFG